MLAKVEVPVCDFPDCGEVASDSLNWKFEGKTHITDVCSEHFDHLMKTSHAPTRGRKPKAV